MSTINGVILNSNDFSISQNGEIYLNLNKTNNKPGMLFIYANWCHFCSDFKPIFNDIVNISGNNVCLSSIEESVLTRPLNRALKINGFPTIYFFDQNGLIGSNPYEGQRNKQAILDVICKVYNYCYTN
jgi:thioredoxin-related protein